VTARTDSPHDKFSSHSELPVKKFLALTQIETVKRVACSPDFATGDKFLFSKAEEFLCKEPILSGRYMKCRRKERQNGFPEPPETSKKGMKECIRDNLGYCELFNI
jgi:hypothetical protein